MGNNMLLPPFFASGDQSKLDKFIESDIFKNSERVWYYFQVDTGYLVRINLDGTYNYVKGYNKSLVQRYTTLPSTAVGDREVLYIVGNTVYTFDGANYVPTYEDLTDTVTELAELISQNTQAITANATAISGLQTSVQTVQSELANKADESDLQTLEGVVANKADASDVYTKSQSYSKGEIDEKIGTVEGGVTIAESIVIAKDEAVGEAKSYVDQQIAFNIV